MKEKLIAIGGMVYTGAIAAMELGALIFIPVLIGDLK